MNDKLEQLRRRICWIDEGIDKVDDMSTYNVVSDITEALKEIYEILEELK